MNAMAKKAYESTAEKIDHFSSKQEQINRWAKGCIMTLNNPAQIARLPAVAQQVVAIVKETKKIEAFCSAVAKKMGELNFPADKTRVVETAINVFKTEFPAGLKELKKRNEVKNCVKFVESHSKTPRIQVIAELKRTREYCNDCAQKIADAGFPEGSKKQLLYK